MMGRSTPRVPGAPVVVWLPALVVSVAVLLPLVYLVVRAVEAGPGLWDQLLRFRTLAILGHTVLLIVTVTAATVVVALPLAWLTVRTDLPGRRFWSVVTVLPLAMPSYVGALVVVAALGPRGLLQQGLERPLGIERLPEIYGLPGAALTLTLLSYPYVLLSIRAGLWGLDPALEEAARGLGKGRWATFRAVVLPQLAPAIAAGALLVALYTLSDFGAVSLLRFDSLTYAIYLQYQASFDRTLAAGFALILVAMTGLILTLEAQARSRGRYYRTSSGSKRPPRLVRLGGWTLPALAFCLAVVVLSVVMPLGVLGYWVVRGVMAGEPLRLLWGPALNSVGVSAAATVGCVVAALPVAVLGVRYPGRLATLVERLSFVGFALPGIVVALALVFFATRYALVLYQTLALLLLAYVVLFLPQAVGSLRAVLLQIKPSLEEAGRSLGHRWPSVLRRVTLPLLRPGLIAGSSLVFLTAMKELPATLILSPIGFQTLATKIWSATADGFFARAAAPAILLVLFSGVAMAVLLWSEKGLNR